MAAPSTIVVLRKDLYGSTAYYPVCDAAHTFAAIAGTRTLTVATLTHIRSLGVAIQLTHPEPVPHTPVADLFTTTNDAG